MASFVYREKAETRFEGGNNGNRQKEALFNRKVI
jgi:hypothetical protein